MFLTGDQVWMSGRVCGRSSLSLCHATASGLYLCASLMYIFLLQDLFVFLQQLNVIKGCLACAPKCVHFVVSPDTPQRYFQVALVRFLRPLC